MSVDPIWNRVPSEFRPPSSRSSTVHTLAWPIRSSTVIEITADFKAFDCPNVFVVGYGMDAGHRFRELPYVGRLVKGG